MNRAVSASTIASTSPVPGGRSLRERWVRTGLGMACFLGLLALISWPFALMVAVGTLALWGMLWVVLVGGLSLVVRAFDWIIAALNWAFEHHPAVIAARAEESELDAIIAAHAREMRAQFPERFLEVEEERRRNCVFWVEELESQVAGGTLPADDETLAFWREQLADNAREMEALRVRAKELRAEEQAEKRRYKKRLEAQRRRRRARAREKKKAERALARAKLDTSEAAGE